MTAKSLTERYRLLRMKLYNLVGIQTTAQRAKLLLSTVPHDKWLIGDFTNCRDKCCALGHYYRLTSMDPTDYSFNNCYSPYSAFRNMTAEFIKNVHGRADRTTEITKVNDSNRVNGYTEHRAKDRVMHLLDDMIKAGY